MWAQGNLTKLTKSQFLLHGTPVVERGELVQVNSLCVMVTRDLAVILPVFVFSLQTNVVVTPWARGRSSQHARESLVSLMPGAGISRSDFTRLPIDGQFRLQMWTIMYPGLSWWRPPRIMPVVPSLEPVSGGRNKIGQPVLNRLQRAWGPGPRATHVLGADG